MYNYSRGINSLKALVENMRVNLSFLSVLYLKHLEKSNKDAGLNWFA